MNIRYPAIIKAQKPSGYFVRFPDIEEAVTQGETIDECLFNAAEVLSLVSNDMRIQLILRNPLDTKETQTTGMAASGLPHSSAPVRAEAAPDTGSDSTVRPSSRIRRPGPRIGKLIRMRSAFPAARTHRWSDSGSGSCRCRRG